MATPTRVQVRRLPSDARNVLRVVFNLPGGATFDVPNPTGTTTGPNHVLGNQLDWEQIGVTFFDLTGGGTWTFPPDTTHIRRVRTGERRLVWQFEDTGEDFDFNDALMEMTWGQPVTRKYPRDDTDGHLGAPRIYPPPRARRLVGNQ